MLLRCLVRCWKARGQDPAVRWCSRQPASYTKDGKFSAKMLDYLVCPLTKQTLEYDAERQLLISRDIEVAYVIVDGVPNMNPKEAKKLKEINATKHATK